MNSKFLQVSSVIYETILTPDIQNRLWRMSVKKSIKTAEDKIKQKRNRKYREALRTQIHKNAENIYQDLHKKAIEAQMARSSNE